KARAAFFSRRPQTVSDAATGLHAQIRTYISWQEVPDDAPPALVAGAAVRSPSTLLPDQDIGSEQADPIHDGSHVDAMYRHRVTSAHRHARPISRHSLSRRLASY